MGWIGPGIKKSDGEAPDNIISPAWYRMMGHTGTQIPEECVPTEACGTQAPGWLNGKHPTVVEGLVTREVCYHWDGYCCNWYNDIRIRNCGAYYVYELQKPPTHTLRYCGNQNGKHKIYPILSGVTNRCHSI